ncbi:Probable Na+/H+ antiporter [Flavobacterium indicum GPTSA100-9 = DSM 17447]|uniref:Probable Na+/H+ antiporter n=1 Tax=Flavobacterium indicum (strain DSM 17447 / CIP 109464 / GPTSA100-9) TaxID=1094466 RepID=H8XTU7_FLAIG|nr:cation:proton antiporter [Flavobacterium indicum]CCG53677.1 Probable Na+/H+ antiporter [Flavobacterium indicum GPTSA100-9 = DSM 17447]
MLNFKKSVFYFVLVSFFSAIIYWYLTIGVALEKGRNIIQPESKKSNFMEFIDSMIHNLTHPLAILLAQIVTIILAARIFGWICKKIGQPSVIGEILAGIVLGPSVIGLYFPEFTATLFPVESLANLQFLSQIGLILFMFVIGMELDLNVLKNKAHDAVVISHASIIIPFTLGIGLAYYIYLNFAPEGVKFTSFGLFLGIAMSITAFPVLARIVQERGLQKTRLGTIVITCAAADDITAWCILAAVIAIVKAGSFTSALYIIALAALYVLFMIKIVKPFLKRVGDLHQTKEKISKPIVAIFFLTLIISAYMTEVIGIHALFGAFMAGAIMPENISFRNIFIEKIEDVALVLLLPLFFVFTGLRTEIGLLNDPYLWKVTGLIILVAVTGKFIGSSLAAKFVGQSWKDSLVIGALMNTRGLMELVVLNIGYDLGVLSPKIFAMMVIMALATTFMTGPALDLIQWIFKTKSTDLPVEIANVSKYKVLISFGSPNLGKSLLKLTHSLTKKMSNNADITVMHLAPTNEIHQYNIEQYEHDNFAPLLEESEKENQKITTFFKASNDIEGDIIEVANRGEYDLLLIGVGQSIFDGSLLGKILGFTTRIINPEKLLNQVTGKENLFENSPFDERTQDIIAKSKVPVGILVDKNLEKTESIYIPIFNQNDVFLIQFAQKFIKNNDSQVIFHDIGGHIKSNPQIKEQIRLIEQIAPNHVALIEDKTIDKTFLKKQDLMLIGIESWKNLIDTKSLWLSDIPSTLIIKNE